MGAVYRAVREDDFRMQVAIKLIKRGTDTEAAMGRFRAERQILARLQHPNIAALFDGGATDDGRPYLVMDYFEGQTLADVVQTFCMVELFLPDYLSKQLPQVRGNKGRAWMLASWGYEESKHSMVLNDWLLKSGHRTEEQLHDMEDSVFEREWSLRYDDPLASVVYTMVQEVATRVNYRNLRKAAGGRCPALDRLLELVQVDEAAHGHFFRQLVSIYLEEDRAATLEQPLAARLTTMSATGPM
jgi:hypothetical protein